jgi:hypothetical protein
MPAPAASWSTTAQRAGAGSPAATSAFLA